MGEEYGLSGRSVARLLRVNELIPELKERLDAGKLNLVAAVQLSYVPEDVQRVVAELDKPISKDMAVKIREEGKTAEDVAQAVISENHKTKAASDKDWLKQIRKRYFVNTEPKKMWETIQKALDEYFERGHRVV